MNTESSIRRGSRKPLIVIIGSTGTGKSNLAISLAKHLASSAFPPSSSLRNGLLSSAPGGAEIINADAMQLYAGLPIITNKLSDAEQEGIPHHLLGSISIGEETWTVNRFVKEADRRIGDIQTRGKTPIVVGGTGYYVHGLLLGGSTLESCKETADIEGDHNTRSQHNGNADTHSQDVRGIYPLLDGSTEDLYARLQEVDPDMAARWHPNDRRKLQRSLEIWLKTGRKASEVYAAQRNEQSAVGSDNKETVGSSLRYDPLILWLDAEDASLKQRLDQRVDVMLENGLLAEAREMSSYANSFAKQGIPIDNSKGIWASIGYKELEPWIEAEDTTTGDRLEKEFMQLRDSCIEAVKAGTRRYAKRQNRYIRIRLANALTKAGGINNLFLLDCSDLGNWHQSVERTAISLVDIFLSGGNLPPPQNLSNLARITFERMAEENTACEQRFARRCETCDKVLMTEKEWTKHVNSRSHKKILQGYRKRVALQSSLDSKPDAGVT